MAINLQPGETNITKIVKAIIALQQGHISVAGTFTLTTSATSTTVPAPTCSTSSTVLLSPTTADAANDMATTNVVAGAGQFVVTHANNARSNRTFNFVVLG
jgi:hypothetical protein